MASETEHKVNLTDDMEDRIIEIIYLYKKNKKKDVKKTMNKIFKVINKKGQKLQKGKLIPEIEKILEKTKLNIPANKIYKVLENVLVKNKITKDAIMFSNELDDILESNGPYESTDLINLWSLNTLKDRQKFLKSRSKGRKSSRTLGVDDLEPMLNVLEKVRKINQELAYYMDESNHFTI